MIEPTDTDGDGIPDITETTGLRNDFGNWYYTDQTGSNNSDTNEDFFVKFLTFRKDN